MANRPRSLWIRFGVGLALGILVGAVSVFGYSWLLRRNADKLVADISTIGNKADAERVIEQWRQRRGPEFWEEYDSKDGYHAYIGRLENSTLARLRLVQPTWFGAVIGMNKGELNSLVLEMGSRWPADGYVYVRAHQVFSEKIVLTVHHDGKPTEAYIDFPAKLPETFRKSVFAFNTKCFLPFANCSGRVSILPFLPQIEAAAAALAR